MGAREQGGRGASLPLLCSSAPLLPFGTGALNKILSQEEIDALLSSTSKEDGRPSVSEVQREKVIHAYDFKHPDRISKDQLRSLRAIHEGFARILGTYLSTTLRTMMSVKLLSIDQLTYLEFTMGISDPSCIYTLNFERLGGNAILEVSPDLVLFIVDKLFGGAGESAYESRSITMIEQNVMGKVVYQLLSFLEESWQHVTPLGAKVESFETNPQFVQIASAAEIVVAVFFEVGVRNLNFTLSLGIPYFVLEPILTTLTTEGWLSLAQKRESEKDATGVEHTLKAVKVPFVVSLGETAITLKEFMDLEVGDTIKLDKGMYDDLEVTVNGRLKFLGRPGLIGNKKAVKVVRFASSEE